MLFTAIGYQELNKADPDCGTTFTWATRAFGPKTGWLGGWGIIAADILVMASLAQVAGQYVFLLFNADGIGHDPTSGWVLLVGVLWIVLMTYICYVGVELSARLQRVLLDRRADHPAGVLGRGPGQGRHRQRRVEASISVSLSWFNPIAHRHVLGLLPRPAADDLHLLGLGQRGVGQRGDRGPEPHAGPRGDHLDGDAASSPTPCVTLAAQSFAGVGDKGIGLGNEDNSGDVLSVLGKAVFGSGALRHDRCRTC